MLPDPDVLFVGDGDVLTSAGPTSGLDACLHLVRADHGAAPANRVARACAVPPWREGGQARYAERPVPAAAGTGMAEAGHRALEHLDRPLTTADLAGRARMGPHTFRGSSGRGASGRGAPGRDAEPLPRNDSAGAAP
ncbi:hypothetical protein [Actinosynnema mirum]|uniref:hypothetical protein n=1 Tax=Actinosynnema mirum TaxID=40567 RepID=UPI00019AB95E|nr:hypothetical protein [Actinosynnema mirum]